MSFRLFACTLALLAAAVLAIHRLPYPDPFASGDVERLRRLAQLPEAQVARLKLQHASIGERAAVGLFGNSRAVQVGAREIGLGDARFFNYAVPGSSMRQSVRLLEAMAAEGRAPRLAVVSLDNFELAFYSPAAWPGAPRSWVEAGADAAWLLARGESMLAARSALDHARAHWRAFKEGLSFLTLAAELGYLLPGWTPALRDFQTRFLADGSRPQLEVMGEAAALERGGGFVLQERYLRRDLERLARVAGQGVEVVVYESPLSPTERARVQAAPLPGVERLRGAYLESCAAQGLRCLPAPELGAAEGGPAWPDCCHAPAALLGGWLGQVVRQPAAR